MSRHTTTMPGSAVITAAASLVGALLLFACTYWLFAHVLWPDLVRWTTRG